MLPSNAASSILAGVLFYATFLWHLFLPYSQVLIKKQVFLLSETLQEHGSAPRVCTLVLPYCRCYTYMHWKGFLMDLSPQSRQKRLTSLLECGSAMSGKLAMPLSPHSVCPVNTLLHSKQGKIFFILHVNMLHAL